MTAELDYRHSAILIEAYLDRAVIILVQGWIEISMNDAHGVCELDLQRSSFDHLDTVGKSRALRQRIFAEGGIRVINNDGPDRLSAGVSQIDLNDMSAAACYRDQEDENHGETEGLHLSYFFSMTRAASTAPLRLSCSLSGKTRMFQFQRLFFLGR